MYLDFCDLIGVNCFPLEPEKSALFITYLDNGKRNVDTIHNYHSSVWTIARLFGFTVPKNEFPEVLLVLKGIKRPSVRTPRIAHPVMPEILLKIRNVLGFVYSISLFLMSFFLMLRKSNVCHTPGTKINFLCRKHVHFKRNGVLVHIFWTKTLQLGERILQWPLFNTKDSVLCPVTAMKNMFQAVPLDSEAALFSYKNGKPVIYAHYLRFFKDCIQELL